MVRPALRLQPLVKSRPNPSSPQCHKLNNNNNNNNNLKVRTLPVVPVYRIQSGIYFARSHKSVINYSKCKSFSGANLWSGLQPKFIGCNASADVFIHSPLLTEGRHITLRQKPSLRIVSMAAMTLISALCQLFIMFDFVRKRSDRFGPPSRKSVRFSSMISESSLEREVGLPWCAFLPHFSYSITFFLNFFSPFITFSLILTQFEGSSLCHVNFVQSNFKTEGSERVSSTAIAVGDWRSKHNKYPPPANLHTEQVRRPA